MGHYQKLAILPRRAAGRDEDEFRNCDRAWTKSRLVARGNISSSVNEIQFSPGTSSDFFVAAGTSIRVLDSEEGSVKGSYSSVKDIARCVAVRNDGRLFVLSDDSGRLQVIDTATRTQLRRMKGHTGSVYSCRFSSNKTQILSGSDDMTLRLWDITDGSCVRVLEAHTDSIRSIAASPLNDSPDIWVSSSYDGTVKLWDMRDRREVPLVCAMDHQMPVEHVSFFPTGGLIVSAGSNQAKIWDLLGGGGLVTQVENHMKTITRAIVTKDSRSMLTASLDRTVKVHCMKTFRVQHAFDFSAPVTALAQSVDSEKIAIGTGSGEWVLRQIGRSFLDVSRGSPETTAVGSKHVHRTRYVDRGKSEPPRLGDTVVTDISTRKNLSRLDRLLRCFQYGVALDLSLTMSATHAVSLMEELIQRGALDVALRCRNETTAAPVLQFIYRNLCKDPSYTPILLEVAETLLEENQWLPHCTNPTVMEMLKRLSQKISFELNQQRLLEQTQGVLDMILAS